MASEDGMNFWLLASTLALLIGVPLFIAGWLACGFRDLRRRLTPPE